MNNLIGGGTASLALLQRIEESEEKLENIGTVYGGNFPGVDLVGGEYKEIAQIEVPPGTYLLIGSSQLNVSADSTFVLSLDNSVAIRFSGLGGGGASASIVKKTDTTKIFRMSMYKPNISTPVQNAGTYFQAIRIK